MTVVSPQNDPRAGYVVYEDSRRSSAERRLRRTLDLLHEAGIAARGAIVDPDPLQALRDALHQYAPVDEVIISTHPGAVRSSWLRGGLVDRARKVAKDIPVTHVEVDLASPRERGHVLVIANQTIVGGPLLAAIRERAAAGPTDFTLVAPADQPGVQDRLDQALAELEARGDRGDRPHRRPRPGDGRAQRRPRRAGGRDHRLDVPGGDVRLAAPERRRADRERRRSCRSSTSSSSRPRRRRSA